ncbi:GNAT family N-acetyltransferase [Actinoplanes sp. NPDC051494]|uniref:GNAT family N-acetyltransferase n=1 Tax=Actinoplanes sp. NPDC051494 TaxID=3363907 RepID=UPI0037BDFE03
MTLVELEPVTKENWRTCAGLTVHPAQKDFVADVTYYLCMCNYGDTWHPLAVRLEGQVVGFCMWARDDDGSRWIGGVVVDAARQRQGIGRAMVTALRDQLAAVPGTPNVALSYQPANTAARALYLALGFVETGEVEDDEVIARWTPGVDVVPTR